MEGFDSMIVQKNETQSNILRKRKKKVESKGVGGWRIQT